MKSWGHVVIKSINRAYYFIYVIVVSVCVLMESIESVRVEIVWCSEWWCV